MVSRRFWTCGGDSWYGTPFELPNTVLVAFLEDWVWVCGAKRQLSRSFVSISHPLDLTYMLTVIASCCPTPKSKSKFPLAPHHQLAERYVPIPTRGEFMTGSKQRLGGLRLVVVVVAGVCAKNTFFHSRLMSRSGVEKKRKNNRKRDRESRRRSSCRLPRPHARINKAKPIGQCSGRSIYVDLWSIYVFLCFLGRAHPAGLHQKLRMILGRKRSRSQFLSCCWKRSPLTTTSCPRKTQSG